MASESVWTQLHHFSKSEFKHPEMLDDSFLLFIDKVRDYYGAPLKLNSDGRATEENDAAVGHAKHSTHLLGRAVDFDSTFNDFAGITRLCTAVIKAALYFNVVGLLGLEIVDQPHDSHIHVDLGGTFPDGYEVPRPAIIYSKD